MICGSNAATPTAVASATAPASAPPAAIVRLPTSRYASERPAANMGQLSETAVETAQRVQRISRSSRPSPHIGHIIATLTRLRAARMLHHTIWPAFGKVRPKQSSQSGLLVRRLHGPRSRRSGCKITPHQALRNLAVTAWGQVQPMPALIGFRFRASPAGSGRAVRRPVAWDRTAACPCAPRRASALRAAPARHASCGRCKAA